tara:strand:- start:3051 stop:3281 length:231 start_codon:yes stop_codon:yes gene_type:complete
MRLFENVRDYKTEANAIKKLLQATECETIDELDTRYRWMIGTNGGDFGDSPRFFPVVLGSTEGAYAHLAAAGVAVA